MPHRDRNGYVCVTSLRAKEEAPFALVNGNPTDNSRSA
jgi:hypothetical protein